MARLLFKLSQVPEDEALEIRQLLDEAGIRYYETDAGFWRVGLDAIWLPSAEQEVEARALITEYQAARVSEQKQNYAQLVAEGEHLTLWQSFRLRPIKFVLTIVAVVFIASLTLLPFLMLLKQPAS